MVWPCMKRSELEAIVNGFGDINLIGSTCIRTAVNKAINALEALFYENTKLRNDNQALKDEINTLKGEQGTPKTSKQKNSDNQDNSSEEERKKRKKSGNRKPKGKKNGKITIHSRVKCEINKDLLPPGASFKGYKYATFQDINISPNNVEFQREVWYSSDLNKSFSAPLPKGYYGQFGPNVRTLVITLHEEGKMTEPAIERFLKIIGIQISSSTISRMITDNHGPFHQEKDDIVDAGIESKSCKHMDDTGCKVNGKSCYTHILCNPLFTAFFTRPKKDRLTILEILCRGELRFLLNQTACDLMRELGLANKHINKLQPMLNNNALEREDIDSILSELFSNPKKNSKINRIIFEATALTYYYQSKHYLQHLMVDDAPQYNRIAEHKSLCWIHEGRHYKKLTPIAIFHKEAVDTFIGKFWDYYHDLLEYKSSPTKEAAVELSKRFDDLFTTVTGYEPLDDRIAKTLAKKDNLLLVLAFPLLPLENNCAELGARVQARTRDINLQTRNTKGTEAKDTFATLVQTARKLGVNFYHYIHDRITKKYEMPSLAQMIRDKSPPVAGTS